MSEADVRRALVDAYVASASSQAMRLWRRVDPANIASSWERLSVDAFAYTSLSQMAVAATADEYVASVVPRAVPLGAVQPKMYGGVAGDGRNLLSLLQQPVVSSLLAIGSGHAPERALEIGGNSLMSIVGTVIPDAARAAEHTAIAARPAVTGYVRTLSPPSCARCAIIAGTWYRWNEGFQRHPRCDCVHVPAEETTKRPTAPREYFDSLSKKMQDRYFGKADAELIRNGEVDLIKHISAKVRVSKSRLQTATAAVDAPKPFTVIDEAARVKMLETYRAATAAALRGDVALAESLRDDARALAGRAYAERATGPRMMPEQLTDGATRPEAIAGLTRYGYLK